MLKACAAIATAGAILACSGPAQSEPRGAAASGPSALIAMPTYATLSVPSSAVVWALVGDQYLFRSTDAGATWRQRPTPEPGSPLFDISFVDDRNGWALRAGPGATQCSFGGATVWRTTDGGATWQNLISVYASSARGGGIDFAQCKDTISFTDPAHGYVTAWDDNSRPTIYHTEDGGLTWQPTTVADPPGYVTVGAGDTLRANRVAGFGATLLVGTSGMSPAGPRSFVFTSTDGGRSWSYLVPSLGDEIFVTATRWLRLEPVRVQETTDGGLNWHPFTTDYTQAAPLAPQFVFADPQTGYATVRGQIQRTTDGGAHWVMVATPGT